MNPFTVTFYSYKGGVGRSLLAANVGVICSRRGKTLLWDMDVEAPGLHHVPDLKPAKPIKRGFFEWLTEWQTSNQTASDADFSGLAELVCQTPVADQLFILPAHAEGADFAALYQGISWDKFLIGDLDAGLALFRGALAAFEAAGFETVLIDSRTGITDIGGLLAALLPHATVMVGNYGQQNTKGLAHVWKALESPAAGRVPQRGDLPSLTRLLVASPIADDVERRASGEAIWKESFGLAPTEMVTVPYDPRLTYSEALYAAINPDSPVAKAYEALEGRIEAVRQQVIADKISTLRQEAERPDRISPRAENRFVQDKTFAERVAHLLRLLGYTVEREQRVDGHRLDLVARKRADFGREEVYFVECKDSQAATSKEAIQVFQSRLEGPTARQMQARGMIVAASAFSPAGLAHAREQGVQVLTYDELERALFDFSPYLARIRQRYEASPLAQFYVDQYLHLEKQPDAQPTPMLPHALAWAAGEGSRLWLVLGDYGTGKSTLVERLAYELARRCENDPTSPIPIAINLRLFPNAISLESLIREHLESELRAVLNPEIVLHLLEAGRVVLLLDSFDEMGVAQAGRSIEEQFRQLVRPTANPGQSPRGNRLLITSRSHFFRDGSSARRAVQGSAEPSENESPLGKAARAFDATLDTLPVFTPNQIENYLHKRLGETEGEQARQRITDTYGLREIASTPQLLDMVVTSLPDLMQQGERITTAALYLTYTTRWLNGFRLSRAEVSVDHMRDLLERMACELWHRPRNQIHYADLAALLRKEQGLARGIDSERVDLELRTASFLVRSADGYYRFSHRSFLEFFFARAIFRAVMEGAPASVLQQGRVNQEATEFLLQMADAEPSTTQTLNAALRTILSAPYVAETSENALLIAHRAAFHRAFLGKSSVSKAKDGPTLELATQFAALIPTGAQMAGARLAAAELPLLCAENLDLRGADLEGANLSGSHLPGVRLDGARLDDARLAFAQWGHAELRAASAQRVDGLGLNLAGACCEHSLLNGADLRSMNAAGADFSDACLRLARLADATLTGASLQTADLAGATWPRAIGHTLPSGQFPRRPRLAGLIGHGGSINACAFSPTGDLILTAGGDGTARLWDAASGKEIRRLEGHGGGINACAFSPDGHHVLTAGHDRTARLWNAASSKEIRRFEGHDDEINACAFSPEGHLVLTVSNDGTARRWDARSSEEVGRCDNNDIAITARAFSPDGNLVLAIGSEGTAQLWDIASGEEIRRLEGHIDEINACAFSPKGDRILTADNGTARLWDIVSGKEVLRFEGHSDWITACAFSPDGNRVLTADDDGTIRLWDAASGKEILRFEGDDHWINACAFSPDGHLVLTASLSGTARLWDAASGKEIRPFQGRGSRIKACAFSPEGNRILTTGYDGSTRLWDAASGKETLHFEEHGGWVTATAFSPQGDRILTVDHNDTARLWDAVSGKEIRRFERNGRWINACAFSPNGNCVLTVGRNSTARLWDITSGKEIRRFEADDRWFNACAFSPKGDRVLTAGHTGTARLWDIASGKEVRRFEGHSGGISACAFSPDGDGVLTAGHDGTARLWDAAFGKEMRCFEGHGGRITCCAFSPNGTRVLTAGHGGIAQLWDASSGKEVRRFEGQGGWISACVFSPDGTRILTAGHDRTVRLWDIASGKEMLALAGDSVGWLAWRHNEHRWDGKGNLADCLRYEDDGDTPTDDPEWIPRHWLAADLPELMGLTPLPAPSDN